MPSTPTGTLFSLATAFAAAKAVTVLTNAAEAVATVVAHGFTSGDVVELTSGWGRMNKRIFEVTVLTVDTFTLEKANTSSTDIFPMMYSYRENGRDR